MAFLLALSSAALYGAADFIGGLTSRRAATIPVVIVSQAAGLVLLAAALLVLPSTSPSMRDLMWGGVAGLATGVGVALLYRALAVGTMAIAAPVTAVCAVLIPVAADLLTGGRPRAITLAGIAVALVSIVLISQSAVTAPRATASGAKPGGVRSPGFMLALLAGVAIGLFFLALARTSSQAGLWPLLAARCASVTLFGVVAAGVRSPLSLPRGIALGAIGGGGLDMLANGLYLLASRQGSLSVVVTLASLYPASTVILARVFLGERLTSVQNAGILCALVAVAMIAGAG